MSQTKKKTQTPARLGSGPQEDDEELPEASEKNVRQLVREQAKAYFNIDVDVTEDPLAFWRGDLTFANHDIMNR